MASMRQESEAEATRSQASTPSPSAKKALGRHSLQVKLFASIAAISLLGMVALVEVSIWQHRSRQLEALARDALGLVMEQPEKEREAMCAGDAAAFEAFAEGLLESSRVAFLRLDARREGEVDRWMRARDGVSPGVADHAAWGERERADRLVRQGDRSILEVAIPLLRVAPTSRPSGEAGSAVAKSGVLWVGLDATGAQADFVMNARQTRQAQALVAAGVLLALWLVTRRALGPVERLADAAERLAEGKSPGQPVATRSAETRRLKQAISKLAARRSSAAPPSASPAAATAPRVTFDVLRTDEPESRRAEALEARAPAGPSQSSAARVSPGNRTSTRVLLVEDNPVNRTVAGRMLEDLGCTVACAVDGLEALVVFEAESFDLVFMDIQMPRMDGLEATRRLRATEAQLELDPTPIVALTAHFQRSDQLACRRAGMNGHVAKPFSAADLERVLVEWCDPSKAADGALPRAASDSEYARSEAPAGPARSPAVPMAEVLDREAIDRTLELCGGDESFLEDLVEAFASRTGTLGDDCQRALEQHDFERVEAVAHELKSSSGQIGAVRLQAVARELESLAAARDGELTRLLEPLLAEIGHAVRALRALALEPGIGR